METRGRGRDARASTDDTRSPAHPQSSQPPAASAQSPQALTRSRSRRTPPLSLQPRAHRAIRTSRVLPSSPSSSPANPAAALAAIIASASPSASPPAPTPPPTTTPPAATAAATATAATSVHSRRAVNPSNLPNRTRAVQHDPSLGLRRVHSSRRASSSTIAPNLLSDSAAAAAVATTSSRSSRKRTRSSRRNSTPALVGSSSTSAVAAAAVATTSSSAGASSSAAALANPRPSKRSRRVSHLQARSHRASAHQVLSVPPTSAGPSTRQTRGMSSGPGDGGQRSQDLNNQRREDEGASSLGTDRAGPTTLQGLLRRLGADLSDIFPGNSGSSHARLQQLRNSITTPESNEQQLEALSELCEFLSVGSEESMVSYSVNLFVSPLVNLLRLGDNVEIKIYAARALTHMMEALPSSSSAIAINGAAGPLCQNLLAIEYIDLAEQSLSALNKLSVDYPHQIVSANGFQAVLSFIDFFSIGVQRVAASTACNLCRSPRADAMDMISGVLPTMMRLLDSDDQRIRESSMLGFTRLTEAFRTSSEKLETLCGEDCILIEKVLSLIVPSSPPALSPQSYSSALRMLSMLSRGSAMLGLQILSNEALIEKLNVRLCSDATVHALDCLGLADSLLPDMPETDNAQAQPQRTRRPRRSSSASAHVAVDVKRREDLERNMNVLQFFGRTLFESLMRFYISSADATARRVSLSVLSKFIAIASNAVLLDVVEQRNGATTANQTGTGMRFCPFVAALLGENSSSNESLIGLAMAASALQKLPSLRDSFFREGVVHEIVRLSSLGSGDGEADEDRRGVHGGQEAGPSSVFDNSDNGANAGSNYSIVSNVDFRDSDAIGSIISSLQRATGHRSSRGDGIPSQSRPPRAQLEIRTPSFHSLHVLVPRAARSILKTYLGANADGTLNEDVFKNTSLGKLTDICKTLDSGNGEITDAGSAISLQMLVKLLVAPERLTVFEISRSGVLSVLSKFLSPSEKQLKDGRIMSLAASLNEDRSGGAFTSFVELALGVLASEEKLPLQISDSSHGSSNSVSSGLRHLSQPFKLRLRKAAAGYGGAGLRDYSHHVVLIEPLATMLSVQEFLWPRVREAERPSVAATPGPSRRRSSRGDRTDRDAGAAHENEAGSAGRGEGNEQGDNEYVEDRFAGVEEMFDMEEENEEEDEVLEEGAAERNSDGSDEEVSSGDEDMIEHDAGESDENENEGPDTMDVDQFARSMLPFELDHDALGLAPSRGSGQGSSTPGDGRGGPASRNNANTQRTDVAFRSYAAALAANIHHHVTGPTARQEGRAAIATGRGDRRRGRRSSNSAKLVFILNGRKVSYDCSILTAIIQSNGEGRSIGSKLWTDVHILEYAKVDEEDVEDNAPEGRDHGDPSASNGRSSSFASDATAPLRRSQRLQENRDRSDGNDACDVRRKSLERSPTNELLSKVAVSRHMVPIPRHVPLTDLPDAIAEIVNVLRQFFWMYKKLTGRVMGVNGVSDGFAGLTVTSNVEFLSHKLSAKMLRQLSDPLALCGGVIPNWCFALARDASLLIPFETRRILFQSTSLGVSRALHSLQTRTDMTGVSSMAHRSSRSQREEARVGRLQRQKVRVHRNRILESAIKVMNFYSTHNTVLEVQYFDEAGIGLGPTLEFYTMASRELQRVDLRLWRGNVDKVTKPKELGGSVSAAKRINHALMSGGRSMSAKRRSRRQSHSAVAAAVAAAATVTNDVEMEEEAPAFVTPTGHGLFPSCLPMLPSGDDKEVAETTTALFGFVGRLIGKSMIDGRLLDLRFSETFCLLLLAYCRVIYEQRKNGGMEIDGDAEVEDFESKCSVDDELDKLDREDVWDVFTSGTSSMKLLEMVDTQLASSLKTIMAMIEGDDKDAVSALCLTFVLPGDDKIELVEGGCSVDVTASNAEEFVRRVVYHVLFGGVYQQAEALLRGLGDLIDLTRLLMFESHELELLSCGPSFENWTMDFLVQATRCDHGYSHESPAAIYFLRILSEMDENDQRRFVLFTTGAPALPLGGLRNLHPRLTIVRRTPEGGRSPDECLPTVMTCTNYFKLPDYTSYDIAKKQIMYAVREGQRSFHLS